MVCGPSEVLYPFYILMVLAVILSIGSTIIQATTSEELMKIEGDYIAFNTLVFTSLFVQNTVKIYFVLLVIWFILVAIEDIHIWWKEKRRKKKEEEVKK